MSSGSRKGALLFGLILIGIGLVFFLSNWYSSYAVWQLIARYWPLFPILIGVKKLYGHFTWKEEDAPASDTAARSPRRRCCPSLLGGVLWLGLGILFLLRNFGFGPDFWRLAGRYWPILLILLGLGKVIDYFRHKSGVAFHFGEIFGLLIVLIVGSAISKIPNSAMQDLFLMNPIVIGGTDVNLGTSYGYTQESTYPLRSGLAVRIDNSHGLVTVSPGSDGEIRMRLRKVVFENEETRAKQIAGEIQIQGGEEGKAEASVFVIKTNREDLSAKNYRFNTDMDISVPKNVQLEILNPFGGVNVTGLDGKLSIDSSHQPLEVRDCRGSFKITSRFAETRLINLTGNLSVEARGRVSLETITGDVDVRNEYSQVVMNNIEGKATVTNTEGSITLDHVTKPVVVDARGSQVTATNLGDSLKITGSHKRIEVTDVAANLVLATSYANVTVKGVKGNVDIESNSDRISLDDTGGYVKVTAQGTSLRVKSVAGPVDISTTLRNVVVNDFSKGCKVINERGDVSLSAAVLGKEDISVRNRNGDITLYLPPSAPFQIDAVARNGHITNEFTGLEPLAGAGDITTLKGKLKTGGPKIYLETENQDIYLRSREVEAESKGGK
jgi:DUF4097 and DUF4098 domain-containing protein YvlB